MLHRSAVLLARRDCKRYNQGRSNMFELKDFFHLSEVDQLLTQIVNDPRGITVVAGLGARSAQSKVLTADDGPLAHFDRSLISAILMRQILDRPKNGTGRKIEAVVLAPGGSVLPIANHQRKQVGHVPVPMDQIDGFTTGLQKAMMRNPDLLVIDLLNTVTAQATFHAAATGRRVLAQIDTMVVGGAVLQELVGLGCSPSQMSLMTWIVGVRRVPVLCTYCKRPHQPGQTLIEAMVERHNLPSDTTYYMALGCRHCNGTGYLDELTAFDIFRVRGGVTSFSELVSSPSQLSLESYMAQLAVQGYIPLEDVAREFTLQPKRSSVTHEAASDEATAELQRKMAELEVANNLLAQRLNKLITLQDVSKALLQSESMEELAGRVANFARELSNADRAILYALDPPATGRVLAVAGWDVATVGRSAHLPESMLERGDPEVVVGAPPGVELTSDEVDNLKVSMRVPLVAEKALIGLLIVSSFNKLRFAQDEIAHLKTIGDQAGILIFRELVVQALKSKLDQLETSQDTVLAARQRSHVQNLMHEWQEGLLPQELPEVPGVQFAAAYRPMQEVGGDLYDVIDLGKGRIGLLIADIDARGWAAVQAMNIVRATVRAEARVTDSPRNVLTKLHHVLREIGDGMLYLTAFFGIYEPKTRRLAYSRAGQDPPLWVRADGHDVLIGTAVGTPLGALETEQLDLAELEIFFSPGDVLILYSDGLTDALDPYGTEFGVQPWVKLARENVELSPDKLCAALFDEVVAFQGGAAQIDDMALLIMSVA